LKASLESAEDCGAIERPDGLGLHVVPVYGSLAPEEQASAFLPAPTAKRKVVLATNIAETSVTIPGIRFVVDSGVVKARAFSAQRAIESLQVGHPSPPASRCCVLIECV
jgi:HrpA-like RNA helicase